MNGYGVLDKSEQKLLKIIDNRLPIVIWGFGGMISFICQNFEQYGVDISYIVDNDAKRWDTCFRNIPIISFETLKEKFSDCNILIGVVTKKYVDEIQYQIKTDGQFTRIYFFELFYPFGIHAQQMITDNLENICKVYAMLDDEKSKIVFSIKIRYLLTKDHRLLESINNPEEEQYFDSDLIHLSEQKGLFIDGGAFHGENAACMFSKFPDAKLNAVCIDADKDNIKYIEEHVLGDSCISVKYAALTTHNGTVSWENSGARGGNKTENNSMEPAGNIITVPAIGIDDEFDNMLVKFIKLDIEGAEVECLKGAVQTIKTYHPILAICIYHSISDHFEIPLMIKEIDPSYKLYVRHYHYMGIETVVYAI